MYDIAVDVGWTVRTLTQLPMNAPPILLRLLLAFSIGLSLPMVGRSEDGNATTTAVHTDDADLLRFVELGTKRAEVVAIMGQPERATAFESISRETLYYPDAQIELLNGVVVGWKNRGNPSIWMGDPQPDAAAVEVGSDENQVLAVMGTPTEVEYSRTTGLSNWRYGSSGIRISGGKVLDWSNFGKLKVGRLERPASIPVPSIPIPPTVSATPRVTLLPPQATGANAGNRKSAAPSIGGGTVRVRGHYRKDGTYVRPHTRRR